MIGVSLDAAPTHSGIVIWEDEKPTEVFQDKWPNWIDMTGAIWKLARFDEPNIEWLAIEGSYFSKNAKVFADLNKILGAVEYWCWDNGVLCWEGTTGEIDRACGIPPKLRRSARKYHTRRVAEMLYENHQELTEDICDAICVGLWGLGKLKEYTYQKNGS